MPADARRAARRGASSAIRTSGTTLDPPSSSGCIRLPVTVDAGRGTAPHNGWVSGPLRAYLGRLRPPWSDVALVLGLAAVVLFAGWYRTRSGTGGVHIDISAL